MRRGHVDRPRKWPVKGTDSSRSMVHFSHFTFHIFHFILIFSHSLKGGKPLSSKCVRDICIRGLRSGNSDLKITPMAIRHTLSNLAHITQKRTAKNDLQFTNAIAFSMRHTPAVHEAHYIRSSKPILQSRTDSIETKLLNGYQLTPSDIRSVSDECINSALLPNHAGAAEANEGEQRPDTGGANRRTSWCEHPNRPKCMCNHPQPKEYATPLNNSSTYSYIQDLFNGEFHHSTPASASILRAKLKAQPATAKKIQENLGLQHFKSLHKLQGKVKTYKTFLKKHQARFWQQAPL